MRCDTCKGSGVCRSWYHTLTASMVVDRPCPSCHGTGIASCCEGMCGGPDEATNGAAEIGYVGAKPEIRSPQSGVE